LLETGLNTSAPTTTKPAPKKLRDGSIELISRGTTRA
jgi:hypothetical protein